MKKNYKRILSLVLMLVLVVAMVLPVSAASGKINKKSTTLIKGQTTTLKVTGIKGKVKWSSSKKSVATVSSKGKVTAKKAGTTTIKAKVGKKTFKCTVKVEAPKLSKTSLTLAPGKYTTIKLNGTKQKVK